MTLQQIDSAVQTYVTWIKAHERYALLAVSGFLVFHFGNSGLNAWIHHDQTKVEIASQQLTSDTTANKELAAQVQTLTKQVNTTNAKLDVAMQKRDLATQKQVTVDQTLTAPDLALRWTKLLSLQPTEIVPTKIPDQLDVDGAAAHATVEALDTIPGLKADNTNLQTELSGEKQIVAVQGTEITGLNQQLVDQQNVCKNELDVQKAKKAKSFWTGAKIGFIGGFIAGIWTGHYL